MDSRTIKEKAREMLKGNYWFLFAISIIGSVIIAISSFAALVVAGPILVGLNIIYLNVYNKKDPEFVDLFGGFTRNFANSFIGYILQVIFIFLWSLLLIIPGIIKGLSYSMTNYILAEDSEISGHDALKKSMSMMDGHKMELFILYLSFIGWALLSILTFGIGFVFLAPYVSASVATFYQELKMQNGQEIDVVEEEQAETQTWTYE